ncbi:MAG: type II toxin-antitoxin system RelE/ParE family toxin [bacterium]|nr:type II toxin-antitoxin system RelE/ParE family toxin [bacterium]
MYKVIIDRRVSKEMESLPNKVVRQVIDTIKALGFNPRPQGSKKLIGEIGWRIRIRDYRILYTIEENQNLVTIYKVKHRKEVYR